MTEFVEYFNNIKADYIINNYETIKHNFRPETEERLNNINVDSLTLFKKYIAKSNSLNNEKSNILVRYTQNNNIGRHFAKGALSLQSLPREIRQTICNDYYIDIDIKNCHPVILCQYAEKNNLSCKQLTKYINNRDYILNKYAEQFNVNKDNIKKSFLSILNGGKRFLKLNDNDMPTYIKKYKDEVIKIQQYIFENEPLYKKLGIINAKKKQDLFKSTSSNELGSTMNIMLCDIENQILHNMIAYLNNKNIIDNNIVLVFDGFQILKESVKDMNIHDLLIKLEENVKNNMMCGLKIL